MKIKKLSRLQMLSIALGLIGIALFIGGTLRVRGVGVSHAQQPADVTICSAISGAKGLTFETVTKSYDEVYGTGGYFNEDGTPQLGHELDYIGKCITPEPPATEEPKPTETVEVVTIIRQDPTEVPQTEEPEVFEIPDGETENELVPSTGIDLAQAAAAKKAVSTGNLLIRFSLVIFGASLVVFGLARKK